MISDFQNVSLFENRFWLQILGDHSRFIMNALSPAEKENIQKAEEFIALFDRLLETARKPNPNIDELNDNAFTAAAQLREFKLKLLELNLYAKIRIALSPTFFNHMLNELEEYLKILESLKKAQLLAYEPNHFNLLWLPDAAGHAAGVISSLDEAETDAIDIARQYEMEYKSLYSKAVNMEGYMRTGGTSFPSFDRFIYQAESKTAAFKRFLEDVRDMRLNARLLGTLTPLTADHMSREECYYLHKLAASTNKPSAPDCDPARPRIEGL